MTDKEKLEIKKEITGDGKSKRLDILNATFISDTNDDYGNMDMDKQLILTGEPGLDWKTSYKMGKSILFQDKIPNQFTYGYVITGHKSQR